MLPTGHVAYPSLAFILIARIVGFSYSLADIGLIAAVSLLPDIDTLYHIVIRRRKFDEHFHHHQWFTHWPVLYAPLLVLFLFWPVRELGLIMYGIYSHFVLDSFSAGEGIMWLYPFSNREANYASGKTAGRHGWAWIRAYTRRWLFAFEIVAFVTLIIILTMDNKTS